METDYASHTSLLNQTAKVLTEASQEVPETSHHCRETIESRRWPQIISEWYLLVVYLLYTTGFFSFMIFWLDGRSFALSGEKSELDSTERISFIRLTQSDIVTIISIGLVISRILCTAWQVIAAWRCVFILFEKTGLSLAEASHVATWRLPSGSIFWPSWSPQGRLFRLRLLVVMVLFLSWPAQLASPVASGSVSWHPSVRFNTTNITLSFEIPSPGLEWDSYVNWTNTRKRVVKKSAGLVNLAAAAYDESGNNVSMVPPARRMVSLSGASPDGTAISAAVVPFFNIDHFEWVDDAKSLSEDILKAIKNSTSGLLTISEKDSPLEQQIPGTSALLKRFKWSPPAMQKLPNSTVVEDVRYAAIYVSRQNNYGLGDDYECPRNTTDFGKLANSIALVNNAWDNEESDCIAVAKLRITAGVTQCSQSESDLGTSAQSTCLWKSGVLTAKNGSVSPDPLVKEVLYMMPEVQALVAAITSYGRRMPTRDLETTLRNSLIQAYQGTWSAFVEFLSRDEQAPTPAWNPVTLLDAQVSSRRMYAWLGMSLLLVLSGVLLMIVQSHCLGKTVNDPVIASLMLDNSDVILADKSGLCNAVDIGHGHGNADMRLKLEVSGINGPYTSMMGGYRHPKLVPESRA
ncbi:multidrug resistance-associated abc transporter [Colletotrichum camelliae]|nr:multidrug resistance-associated abc transporter [Colletotrichum camelliae]